MAPWPAGRAIQPIQTISATACRIAEGRLSERIDAAEMDNEPGQLATVLNKTFSRLDDAFVRQQQFTADASVASGEASSSSWPGAGGPSKPPGRTGVRA